MTKTQAFRVIGAGFVWLIAVLVLAGVLGRAGWGQVGVPMFSLALVGFTIFILIGMGIWAGAKGYHPAIGVALAFFCSGFGMLVLVFLPDRSRKPPEAASRKS